MARRVYDTVAEVRMKGRAFIAVVVCGPMTTSTTENWSSGPVREPVGDRVRNWDARADPGCKGQAHRPEHALKLIQGWS